MEHKFVVVDQTGRIDQSDHNTAIVDYTAALSSRMRGNHLIERKHRTNNRDNSSHSDRIDAVLREHGADRDPRRAAHTASARGNRSLLHRLARAWDLQRI